MRFAPLLRRPCLGFASLIVGATAATAAPGGRMSVMPLGIYSCGVPGDALGSVRQVDESQGFHVIVGSSYAVGEETGNYLLTGDRLQMSNGPMKGRTFSRESASRLREIVDGQESETFCIRIRPLPKG